MTSPVTVLITFREVLPVQHCVLPGALQVMHSPQASESYAEAQSPPSSQGRPLCVDGGHLGPELLAPQRFSFQECTDDWTLRV